MDPKTPGSNLNCATRIKMANLNKDIKALIAYNDSNSFEIICEKTDFSFIAALVLIEAYY